ncbi:MAG: mycothiol synthase [Leucobacter sp.]|nr:mycothiol synthase [Leucobacter sp.]
MPIEIRRSGATDRDAALADVREVLAAAERADGFPAISDQALLAAAQGRREVLLAMQTTPSDGTRTAAVGILGEGELDLAVHPADRSRGVGTRMLDALLRTDATGTGRAPHGASDGGEPHELRAWAHGENPAAQALLARAGFAPARSLLRLALDPAQLPEAIAGARPLPDGFALRAFDPARADDASDWVRVNAAAFASHPEQGGVTLDDFAATRQEPWFDADDLILAFAPADAPDGAGELAGYTWIKTLHHDGDAGSAPSTETELYVLGVGPGFAGRGLGAALLGETLRRMAAHRPDRITLYVDGDNENALALYERAGFTIDQLSTQWVRR